MTTATYRAVAAAIAFTALLAAALLVASTPGSARAGMHYLPHKLAVKTNERFGHSCFWAPPKGMDYADLPGVLPIQVPRLFPDVGSTYFVARYVLPAGASLTLHGTFPRERYMSFTMFNPLGGGQIGPGDSLRDDEIVPDRGSFNPFLPGHRRNTKAKRRAYTIHIVRGEAPAHPAPNTLYTGQTDPAERIGMSQRNYLSDRGRLGNGGVGLPKVTLNLAGGAELTGRAACRALDPTFGTTTATFPQELWKRFVSSSGDPVNAPAVDPPVWERFWNALYSVAGIFTRDPAERLKDYPPSDTGGFQSNPDTRYMTTMVSLKYGPVITVSGKLPRVPRTLPRAKRWPDGYQVRYWSLCTGSSPVTGHGFDCAYDQQVPVRKHRRYTLVISKRADRPENARPRCGYRWLNFGKGEDYPDPASRDYSGVLYMRFMDPRPGWKRAPQRVEVPGTERRVMGPYFPRSRYWSTAGFEKRGCHASRAG